MKIIVIPNMPVMSGRHYCLSRELSRQGHQVTYFMWQLPNDKSVAKLLRHAFTSLIPRTYKYESFTVNKAIRLPFFWPIINGWIFKYQLRQLYKRTGADIVITESYTNETEVPKNLPFIYDLADDYAGPAEVYGSKLYKLAFRLLNVRGIMKRQCQNAVAVTSVSKALNDYASELNPNSILLPNGVDQKLVEKVLRRRIDKVNPHSIVYATGFGPWSRAIETLETVTKLRAEFPDITLTLVGSGSETEKIKQYIKDNQAGDYISYLGYVFDQKQLFTILQNHAIGLNISDKNAWRDASHPMKVMDYSALGMKVVSTNLTEVEALGYDNLFIFSDTDKGNTFIKTLRKALKTDKPTQYSDVSKKVLRDYGWKNLMGQLMILCKSSLDQRQNEEVANSVVHVTYSYPPILGGLEKVAQQLAQAQSASGMQVSVLTARRGLRTRQDYHDTIPVSRLWSFEIANTTIIPALLWQLLKIKKNTVVHLHIAQAFSPEIVWLAAKIKGFRYVAHVHLDVPPSGPAGFLLKIYKPLVLGRVLRAAHAVAVFTSDQVKTFVERYHIDPKKIHAVPNGVGVEFFINKPHKLHKKPRLLFVGRLNYQKNLKQLLYALDGISDKFATTIVGDGELKDELINLASSLKLKNVSFVGSASGETLVEYYKKADIFVLPSEREGMPLVLLEAMAAGLPIVATKVTGNKDVVKHGKNGLLVPYDNAKSMRASLLRIVGSKDKYTTLSKNSLAMSREFSWQRVIERFGRIYKTGGTQTNTKPNHKSISLAWAASILLVISILVLPLNNVVVSFLPTIFFLTIPGYLILRRLTANQTLAVADSIGLSVILSTLFLMISGLALNLLRQIDVQSPLNPVTIVLTTTLFTVVLIVLNRHERISLPSISLPSTSRALMVIALGIVPLLAAAGSIRLNNGASNILTMASFGLSALLLAILVFRKSSFAQLYPFAIFSIALGVLLSTSLRGWYITGHDIVHEFQVFQATMGDGFWSSITAHRDPYSACLSITVLPTILAAFFHISDPYIFKILFQIIFAIGVVLLYGLSLKLSGKPRVALLATLLFIAFPPFLNDMPFLNRQEIAFMFFIAAALISFSGLRYKTSMKLSILLLLGIALSHYSTSYVTLGLLGFSWLIYRTVVSRYLPRDHTRLPLLNPFLILGFLIVTFFWNTVITRTSPGLTQTIRKTIQTIETRNFSQANGVGYSILSFGSHDPQATLDEYVNDAAKNVQYYPDKSLEKTSLGEGISKIINVETLNKIVRGASAKLFQIFLLGGIVLLALKTIRKKGEKDAYLLSFNVAGFILLAMMVILPILSEKYSVTRLFQQVLVFGAVPITLAAAWVFEKIRIGKSLYWVAGLYIFLFLHLSGFIPQLTGGYPPQMALNNKGVNYDVYYQHSGEIISASWLDSRSAAIKVGTDEYGLMRFPNYPFQKTYGYSPVLSVQSSIYIYQNDATKRTGAYADFISGDVLQYTYGDQLESRNLIYTNQNSNIYGQSKSE